MKGAYYDEPTERKAGPDVSIFIDPPEMTLKVVLVNQYGQEVIRPGCEKSEIFCQVANTRTMTRRMVDLIKRLGYKIEVVQTQPKEL